MDALLTLVLDWAKNNWYEAGMTLLSIGALAKYITMRAVAKELFDFVKEFETARADGKYTDAEYTQIGKATVPLAERMWGYTKGLFPNRSKV